MEMDNWLNELFHFLEQSPYFYEKRGNFIAEPGGVKDNTITYTFFAQDNPYQAIAEISIPLENPYKEIGWKYIQLNENQDKPAFQANNQHLGFMPGWFKYLIQKVNVVYEEIAVVFRAFA